MAGAGCGSQEHSHGVWLKIDFETLYGDGCEWSLKSAKMLRVCACVSACVRACKVIWHSYVNLRYAKSWAVSAAGTPGHYRMKHSKSYKVNNDIWNPRSREDGGTVENLATAYVCCCVWMLCLCMQPVWISCGNFVLWPGTVASKLLDSRRGIGIYSGSRLRMLCMQRFVLCQMKISIV